MLVLQRRSLASRDADQGRKSNAHRGAYANLGRDLDRAVVIGHDTVHDRQPKARTSLERASERLKDTVEIFVSDPAPFIPDRQDHPLITFRRPFRRNSQP